MTQLGLDSNEYTVDFTAPANPAKATKEAKPVAPATAPAKPITIVTPRGSFTVGFNSVDEARAAGYGLCFEHDGFAIFGKDNRAVAVPLVPTAPATAPAKPTKATKDAKPTAPATAPAKPAKATKEAKPVAPATAPAKPSKATKDAKPVAPATAPAKPAKATKDAKPVAPATAPAKPTKATKDAKPVAPATAPAMLAKIVKDAKPTAPSTAPAKPAKAGKVVSSLTSDAKAVALSKLEAITADIRKETGNIASAYMRIGYRLYNVREQKLYLAVDVDRNGKPLQNVYDYCDLAFGFKKSTAISFIRICEKFSTKDEKGQPTDTIDPAYSLFGYSQLSEMLSLPDEKLSDVEPSMTVKAIRGLKSDQMSSQSDDDFDDSAEVEKTRTVAFSGEVNEANYDRILAKLEKLMGYRIQIVVEK